MVRFAPALILGSLFAISLSSPLEKRTAAQIEVVLFITLTENSSRMAIQAGLVTVNADVTAWDTAVQAFKGINDLAAALAYVSTHFLNPMKNNNKLSVHTTALVLNTALQQATTNAEVN